MGQAPHGLWLLALFSDLLRAALHLLQPQEHVWAVVHSVSCSQGSKLTNLQA